MITYLIFMAPAILFAMWAQFRVKSAYTRNSQIPVRSGLTGAEAAAAMLRGKGIEIVASAEQAQATHNAVAIEAINGYLSDHYDPRAKVLRLSPKVYGGRSLAAVGIACHEAGHALQDANNYLFMGLRTLLVPTASLGSNLALPLILAGAIFGWFGLIKAGILLFTAIVLFQLITLPVEFNASTRAKRALIDLGIVQPGEEQAGVASVLNAAAMTYVAAAASAVATLLYYLMIFAGGSRD